LHYLARAYASAEETIEHLQFLMETGSASRVENECDALIDEYEVLCRKLFNYMTSVQKEHDPKRTRLETGGTG
jgi:DNA-binding ferritin-like protein